MNLTKRTLTKWRKEALKFDNFMLTTNLKVWDSNAANRTLDEINKRILRMTQILLDQDLMKGK